MLPSKGGDKIDLGLETIQLMEAERWQSYGWCGRWCYWWWCQRRQKQTDGLRIQEWGDRAQYKGKAGFWNKANTQYWRFDQALWNKDTNTSDSDEGTDIAENIEILEFSSGGGNNANEVLLSVNAFKESYIDPKFSKLKKKLWMGQALMMRL